MGIIELLQHRRSVRRFEHKPVEKEKIDRILQAALLSPSSKGTRPWEFVLVEDRRKLAELSECKPHGSSFLADAAFGVVVIADTKTATALVEDTSIASLVMQLASEEEGLGSCWIQVRGRGSDKAESAAAHVRQVLSIPDDYEVEAVIAGGYPAEKEGPYDLNQLLWDKVHKDRFGDAYPKV